MQVLIVGYANSFVRAYKNGTIGDAPRPGNKIQRKDLWKPVQNEDGSWSLRSHYGSYLSSDCADNLACVQPRNGIHERFELEPNENVAGK